MSIHELAGKPAPKWLLANIPRLVSAYYTHKPDVSDPDQRVAFGTSGHRGSSLRNSFNEAHILAISQAIAEYRKSRQISGPLFMGMDTHALSESGFRPPLEALIEVTRFMRLASRLLILNEVECNENGFAKVDEVREAVTALRNKLLLYPERMKK